ncbi:MAG TPA: hemerythrin domain-containing protein [Acidimicrobiales bacterium]|nr:hemerythrin domain-containing protein [Acidimicrobiales bacterium]
MTDAITVLTTDHRAVDGLFSQIEGQDAPDQDLLDRIVKELSIHDAIEREHLYPVLRERLPDGDRWSDRSVDEHNEIATTLVKVDKRPSGTEGLATLLASLISEVRTHVQEEEGEIFPALRAALSQTELDDLGATLEKAKTSAPTRPHPHAPDEGTGTKVAGAVSAPLDRLRDAAQGRS